MPITSLRSSGPLEDRALAAMFEARKQVFVDLLRWDLPVLDGRFEVDEFDDRHAVYLIVSDRDGGHLGSARLLPTTRPYLLATHFPSLCASLPCAPDSWEITRFCLDRRLAAPQRRAVRDQLVSGLARHALEHGIQTYYGVAELPWLQQILAFGWRCDPAGLPRAIGSRKLGALRISIDEETPALLAANGIGETAPLAAAA
ncbi:acyl-homoserine-lactone synthase [Sphingomonas sp. ASV193]|uniref:acyl-homoserine-lactone synthase n=1 Tax=Sphingomonas sp. ASV193 TaxID=3144405 RepID=UPI0032E8CF72